MAIVRIDPFRELAGMQERMSRLMGDLYSRRADDDLMASGSWLPPVDIFQNGNHELVLKAELPGIKREDIDIRVENNTLTIRGERKFAQDVKEDQYHRIERSYGSFSRSFSLPNTIASDKVSAEFKDGILTVTLPVREEAKPKQITVQVS
jgi:HSP20 family protein